MRLIDADEVKKRFPIMENDFGMVINERLHKHLDEIPTIEAIPKDQYEARLKADMVAMLEQLDLEIQEQTAFMGDGEEANGMKRVDSLVKDKINALKQSIWQDNYNGPKEVEQ